jgi:hypothetical protein
MIRLDRPAHTAAYTYAKCISRVQDPTLFVRLTGATQAVIDASAEYDHAATHNQLHLIAQQATVGGLVTQHEMEAVYTQRMAKKGAPGREVYDALLTSAPQGKCPLCVHRSVSTLDHHLPKARYPALAVVPLNLLPACSDCNKSKLAMLPTNASEEALHPYFDNIDGDRWLYAEVVNGLPAALRFLVNSPEHWTAVMTSRVQRHFQTLSLGKLYAAEAADELLNIRHQLSLLHRTGGMALVRAELEARAESCRIARPNGWRTATFEAFAASDWFCDGGFA